MTWTARRLSVCATLICSLSVSLSGGALAKGWTENILHNFAGAPDGSDPFTGPVMDANGNLYGATTNGGAFDQGAIYRISADGTETILYSFAGGTDGYLSTGPLMLDKQGNLFGTTVSGGNGGFGTVFEISNSGVKSEIYDFNGDADGSAPEGGLVEDNKGNLYGTTYAGGQNDAGTVFKITPDHKKTTLYKFCSATKCSDGAQPRYTLLIDKAGNLYGTTQGGGTYNGCGNVCGVVFKLSPQGEEAVLHAFCSQGGCPDGYSPTSGLAVDKQGNFYGTTWSGGSGGTGGHGVVYKLAPDGTETILHSFQVSDPRPYGVILDGQGTLFGLGLNGPYSVFSISPAGKMKTLYTFNGEHDTFGPTDGLVGVGRKKFTKLYGANSQGGTSFNGMVFELDLKSKTK